MKKFLFFASILLVLLISANILVSQARSQKPLLESYLTGKYLIGAFEGVFNKSRVKVPPYSKLALKPNPVLGTSSENKTIFIDITNQTLSAYEGLDKVYEFPISSGLWDKTPRGQFEVWIKLKYTRMEGGSEALGTYYNLPNVPYTMYFYNTEVPKEKGFGIHGAYWHNNFGHPMSHGCINLKIEDAEKLFYWATPNISENEWSKRATEENTGTKIIIFGKYNYNSTALNK